jgi:hypothetical protein
MCFKILKISHVFTQDIAPNHTEAQAYYFVTRSCFQTRLAPFHLVSTRALLEPLYKGSSKYFEKAIFTSRRLTIISF